MRLGAHVPTRGRLSRAVDYALEVGAEAIQLFVSNPRAWAQPPARDEEIEAFVERRRATGIGPVFVHASYLVNIASADDRFLHRSVELAAQERLAAAEIGADGLVVHAGAGGPLARREALTRAAASVRALLATTEGPPILLELTAGGTGSVASTIRQASELLDAIDADERVGLCLDTCHLVSAGYPLDQPGSAPSPFEEVRAAGLGDRLRLVHANDSRDPRGSRRDRHQHIGAGTVGREGFRAILRDRSVRELPVLIETPGDEPEDVVNLGVLRELAAGDRAMGGYAGGRHG